MGLDLRRTPEDTEASSDRLAVGPALPPRARATALHAGGPILVTCDGVEVTQAIQDMAHTVPLVAGKRTIARVYLSVGGAEAVTLSGVLQLRKVGSKGRGTVVLAQAAVTIDPGLNGNLRAKRESEARSLNFILPREVLTAGAWEVRLRSLHRTVPNAAIAVPAGASRAVSFVAAAPLRVRIVGIRYQSGGQTVAPSPLDFTLIQSWLGRAYPVPSVEWSQVVVDGPDAWPFQAPSTNAFIRGLRTTDVAGGVDARTHYYALVADNDGTNFMRGLASGIPTVADPSAVASGPTGGSDFGWDHDGSYGDWYTGHELGHTFGRFHAEFCGAGGGAPYPFANGQLSNANGAFVGFDVGDIANGLPPKAMPGTTCHDVMSYCVNQWISSFTYDGIRTRLLAEDAMAGPPLPASRRRASARRSRARGGAMPPRAGTIHVVATLNVTRATGQLRHVTPQPAAAAAAAPQAAGPGRRAARGAAAAPAPPAVSVRVYGGTGRLIVDHATAFIPDSCRDPGDDLTGAIDTLLPAGAAAARLELVLNGAVVDTFTPAPAPAAVTNIRGRARAAGPRGTAARGRARGLEVPAAADEGGDPVLTWTTAGPRAAGGPRGARARAGAAAAPAPAGADTRYTVQVSVDGGLTWQTVGFALKEPEVRIDRTVLGDAASVKVRVTATSGFASVTSEKTMKATELG